MSCHADRPPPRLSLAQAYVGLCATTYDLLLPSAALDDEEFYREAIADARGPGLEIGCGTGRLLIPYRQAGLDVDGVDPSEAMLSLCRAKARALGLEVALYAQAAEQLRLARRYRLIFVPACSFMLIVDEDAVTVALRRLLEHLEPGGRVVIPLGLPWKADVGIEAAPSGEWRLRRQARRPGDGALVQCWEQAGFDFAAQIKHTRLRYEVHHHGRRTHTEEHVLPLRWHLQEEFAARLASAGFVDIEAVREHSWEPADHDDAFFTFVATRQ